MTYKTDKLLWIVTILAITTSTGCDSPRQAASPEPATKAVTPAPSPPDAKAKANHEVLSVGIVPQQAASKLARLWTPILKRVGDASDLKLRFETAPDIPEFERRCAQGAYDIVYMNPYHYTMYSKAPGYKALAKRKGSRIHGILVKKRGSPLSKLSDLEGSELAFPAPKAFAATLLTSAGLDESGVTYTRKFVSSHDSVYRGVAKGLFPAGGGIVRTLNNLEPSVRDQLEVLWKSQGYTPHAIATHPRVSDSQRAKLLKALVALDTDQEGQTLLKSIKLKGIVSAMDKDWDDVRGLNIKTD